MKALMRPLNVATLRLIGTPLLAPSLLRSSSKFCARYGRSLVQFDPAAEARLRWKIDLYVVPTVSMLYLFCFIDRANIGT